MAELLPLFAQSGVFGVVMLVGYWLHRDAVGAERGRADDWRATAQEWKATALERERQLSHILGAVREATGAPS